MQSLLQVSGDEIASNFRHAIRMQFLVGSPALFFAIHEAEGRESTVDSSWNVFSHLWSPLPYPTTIIFVFGTYFPDLAWCVMKQLGEIAAEVVDDAVTTTGVSLDALHTP